VALLDITHSIQILLNAFTERVIALYLPPVVLLFLGSAGHVDQGDGGLLILAQNYVCEFHPMRLGPLLGLAYGTLPILLFPRLEKRVFFEVIIVDQGEGEGWAGYVDVAVLLLFDFVLDKGHAFSAEHPLLSL